MALRAWAFVAAVMLLAGTGCKPTRSVAAVEEAAAARSPAVEAAASEFTLLDQNDKPARLRDHRGRWVVPYFYPANDTPGCICEATEFAELPLRFKDVNAAVYGSAGSCWNSGAANPRANDGATCVVSRATCNSLCCEGKVGQSEKRRDP